MISWAYVASGVFVSAGVFQGLWNTWPSLVASSLRAVAFIVPALLASRSAARLEVVHEDLSLGGGRDLRENLARREGPSTPMESVNGGTSPMAAEPWLGTALVLLGRAPPSRRLGCGG